jgi:hypothetical protein
MKKCVYNSDLAVTSYDNQGELAVRHFTFQNAALGFQIGAEVEVRFYGSN